MFVRDLKHLTGQDSEFALCAACGVKQWAYGLTLTPAAGKYRGQEVPAGSLACNEHTTLLHPEEAEALRLKMLDIRAKKA